MDDNPTSPTWTADNLPASQIEAASSHAKLLLQAPLAPLSSGNPTW